MYLFKRKSKLEVLKIKYRQYMRDSFRLALKDQEKSLLARQHAGEIWKQINMLKTDS